VNDLLSYGTAFHFIADHVRHGVVLTGTGKAPHLAENVASFRSVVTAAQSGVHGT
jgi:hypothetical protein